jgi:hypothetical protein
METGIQIFSVISVVERKLKTLKDCVKMMYTNILLYKGLPHYLKDIIIRVNNWSLFVLSVKSIHILLCGRMFSKAGIQI